jgi:tetratricopeptide (TPR) repeat protein
LFYLDHERLGGNWRYALAAAAFLLSTLAKGIALTMPTVLLALAWWQRGRITRRDLLRVLPYVLIGAVMAGVEVWGQHLAAHGDVVRSDGLLSRAALAGCAVWFYLGKLACPLRLCFFYPRWTLHEPGVLPYLPGAVLAVLAALAWSWRATWGRSALMLLVCYVGLLLPILGFVDIYYMRYSLVADHWQYAAMLVPCAVFAGMSASLARRIGLRLPANLLLSLGLLAALAGLSWRQSRMYAGPEILYRTTIERDPACWLAHENLGIALAARGRADAALAEHRKALEIKPDSPDAHNNLGVALELLGRADEAIAHYQIALELKPRDAQAHNNLGNALAGRGAVDEAICHYRKALEIEPDSAGAQVGFGNVLLGRGRLDEAIAHYERALGARPDYAEARYDLAKALAGRGRTEEAIAQYERALAIKSDFPDAHNNLANALARCGRTDEAVDHYRSALRSRPDDANARRNLAVVIGQREKVLSTLAELRRAIRTRPNDAAPLNDAAWILATNPNASIRNGNDAVDLAERARRLTGGRSPVLLDTLAAAYAETGRFADAVQTAGQAAALAARAGEKTLVERIRSRLELYSKGKPYRQRPG